MNNKIHQGRADYFLGQSAYMLLKAINIEIENIKDAMSDDNDADISYCCTRIGTLVSLKTQVESLIEKP